MASGRSRGHCRCVPSQGSRFFCFDIQIFLNIAASGVGTPHKVGAPPWEILDPSLMAMQFNKPKFDWEVKDCLSELEQFKEECSVLFQGPLSVMKDAEKVGLNVNWIGHQCIITLHSMGIALDRPKTVFDNLEKIFRPESNQTLSRFKFRGLKQKQSQTCDSYMSELQLAIVECRYPEIVQDELLKGQYIFSLCIKEIQDHLLGEIVAEDIPEKCLLESCKVESKIEQRKLLGIKAAISYDSVQTNNRGRGKLE